MGRIQGQIGRAKGFLRHRPHFGVVVEKPRTGHHNSTPASVLNAPKSVPVLLTYESAGYRQAPDGSLRRTTPRRGKKVRRGRDV